jgi:hypothetical protein
MAPDRLQLMVELLKIIAWPVTLLITALIFQAPIRALLARVKRGRVGTAEIEFEEAVRELAPSSLPPEPALSWLSLNTLSVDTRSVVLQAWLGVEEAARRLLQKSGTSLTRPLRGPVLAGLLQDRRALARNDLDLFRELRSLRNQANVEEFHPSAEAVLLYVQAAAGLKATIERAAQT